MSAAGAPLAPAGDKDFVRGGDVREDNAVVDDTRPDDELESRNSRRLLDHAPATSHGSYLKDTNDGLEDLEEYQEEGYHPVHLGDRLGGEDRYHIMHKLGHGGFGTVWLCRDTRESRYIAVKIHIASLASDDLLDLHLATLDRSAPGADFLAIPLDNFVVEGPNGVHQCLVLPIFGPHVSPDLWLALDNPGLVLRLMGHQAALALEFLHRNRVCHGDFRPANILVKLANLDHLDEKELLSLLGQPRKCQVMIESGEDIPSSTPQYLVAAADLSKLDKKYLKDEICVIDFGESFFTSSPLPDLGILESYLPPELLVQIHSEEEGEGEKPIGRACDLWALGCTLFEIRQQMPLFYMITDPDELLAEMVGLFGIFPKRLWTKWKGRGNYFDENGARLEGYGNTETLEMALAHKAEVLAGGEKKALSIPDTEQRVLGDLLGRLFRYEPDERLTAAQVVEHEWFLE